MSLDYVSTWFLNVASILNSTSDFRLLSVFTITTLFVSFPLVCLKTEHLK